MTEGGPEPPELPELPSVGGKTAALTIIAMMVIAFGFAWCASKGLGLGR